MAEQPLHWIHPEDYTLDVFLLFDRWIIRYVLLEEIPWYDKKRDYRADLAKALSKRPYVADYCRKKAPEVTEFLERLQIPGADTVDPAGAAGFRGGKIRQAGLCQRTLRPASGVYAGQNQTGRAPPRQSAGWGCPLPAL